MEPQTPPVEEEEIDFSNYMKTHKVDKSQIATIPQRTKIKRLWILVIILAVLAVIQGIIIYIGRKPDSSKVVPPGVQLLNPQNGSPQTDKAR